MHSSGSSGRRAAAKGQWSSGCHAGLTEKVVPRVRTRKAHCTLHCNEAETEAESRG